MSGFLLFAYPAVMCPGRLECFTWDQSNQEEHATTTLQQPNDSVCCHHLQLWENQLYGGVTIRWKYLVPAFLQFLTVV